MQNQKLQDDHRDQRKAIPRGRGVAGGANSWMMCRRKGVHRCLKDGSSGRRAAMGWSRLAGRAVLCLKGAMGQMAGDF
ncbi:hypothetical protein L484_016954 [Morus notabilis]|uniref:Uncharacterized protein n=1 Tax=Morus notabilis TaxID=981085 RepID=W9QG33_9ROSA|nr:hypothetical protein L484_016954 [Morus notabilis]